MALRKTWLQRAAKILMSVTLFTAPLAQGQTVNNPIEVDHSLTFPRSYLRRIENARRFLISESTVYFPGSLGEKVAANIIRPARIKEGAKLPAVILQYGLTSNRNSDYIIFHAAKLALKGYVVISVDAPGTGDRRPLAKGESPFTQFENYTYDYGKALDYVSALSYVDPERISFIGVSWGAITGITFAANEPRIKATIAIGSGGNIPTLSPDFDPINHIAHLAGRNLLMINGRFDLIINPWLSIALRRAAPEDAEKIWVNSEHYFIGVNQDKLSDTMYEFLAPRVQ